MPSSPPRENFAVRVMLGSDRLARGVGHDVRQHQRCRHPALNQQVALLGRRPDSVSVTGRAGCRCSASPANLEIAQCSRNTVVGVNCLVGTASIFQPPTRLLLTEAIDEGGVAVRDTARAAHRIRRARSRAGVVNEHPQTIKPLLLMACSRRGEGFGLSAAELPGARINQRTSQFVNRTAAAAL